MSHAHLLVRRLVGGALGVLLPTVCAHAQMFDTVSSLLSVQFLSHTIETRERLIFQNTSRIPRLVDPGYREHQPRMKFAGLKDKDLEKELSEAIERENEISEALDRCFASAKEDLRLLSLEHERAEKLSRELTIAQQEISSLKTLLAEARGTHQRRDEPNLDTTPPRQNDLHSSAVRFVAAPVESWSNTLSSSCDPGSSACIVEGVVDWITRNEKRGTKSSGTGVFLVPGFAKFVVIKKPATNPPCQCDVEHLSRAI